MNQNVEQIKNLCIKKNSRHETVTKQSIKIKLIFYIVIQFRERYALNDNSFGILIRKLIYYDSFI